MTRATPAGVLRPRREIGPNRPRPCRRRLPFPRCRAGASAARPDVHLSHVRGQQRQGLDRVAHAVEDHVCRVEVHTRRKVRRAGRGQFFKHAQQRRRVFLPGLKGDAHALVGKGARHLPQAIEHHCPQRVGGFIRQKPRVERDQFDPPGPCQPGVPPRRGEVRGPVFIGAHAARGSDRLERRVVLAARAHHPGKHPHARRGERAAGRVLVPALFANRVERDLHRTARRAAGAQALDQLGGAIGLERPGTHADVVHGELGSPRSADRPQRTRFGAWAG